MSRAFARIKDGIDDIQKWKAGRTKATVWFNGQQYRMTYKQHQFLLLGQKGALNAGRLAGIREAAEIIEAHAKDMMVYRDHHYVAKHLRSAKDAVLALVEGKEG